MRTQVNQDILERWLVDNIVLVAQEYNFALTEEEQKREREKRSVDVQKARMKLERLKDLYLSNLILKDMYEKEYTALTALIFEGEQKEREERKPIDLTIFENFKKTYWDLSMESRKALWSRVIERIIVTESGDYIVRVNQL
jgi:hypothetical protein